MISWIRNCEFVFFTNHKRRYCFHGFLSVHGGLPSGHCSSRYASHWNVFLFFFVFFNFWRTWFLFVGPLITLFWTSGDVSLFMLGGGVCVTHSLRFTSGVTGNLLMASMAVEPSLPHSCEALVGLETWEPHSAGHSVRSGRPEALPNEISRLGWMHSCFQLMFCFQFREYPATRQCTKSLPDENRVTLFVNEKGIVTKPAFRGWM